LFFYAKTCAEQRHPEQRHPELVSGLFQYRFSACFSIQFFAFNQKKNNYLLYVNFLCIFEY
jgi:hypothetical protein